MTGRTTWSGLGRSGLGSLIWTNFEGCGAAIGCIVPLSSGGSGRRPHREPRGLDHLDAAAWGGSPSGRCEGGGDCRLCEAGESAVKEARPEGAPGA